MINPRGYVKCQFSFSMMILPSSHKDEITPSLHRKGAKKQSLNNIESNLFII